MEPEKGSIADHCLFKGQGFKGFHVSLKGAGKVRDLDGAECKLRRVQGCFVLLEFGLLVKGELLGLLLRQISVSVHYGP